MFKKFKDKLAEEMKQSPSRLQAGMQQLAQAVISPATSNNLIQDMTTSVDDLSQTAAETDTTRNNSAINHFQSVDLQAPNSMERSRRSSYSSVTSDNFFPSYESPGNLYHLQSDMEQSASEFEDSSSSTQLEHVTKDELYAGYQKLRKKYTKYRAVYRELYKENMKMKSVLVETQDKALRRIANLKEQCQLEKDAKAHLEEALRNDMEEKDHLIDALTTKIKLLQSNGSNADSPQTLTSNRQDDRDNIDLLTDSPIGVSDTNDNLAAENVTLKEKIKKFEMLLAKCNESLKKNKEKISQLTENRDILERDLTVLRNGTTERTKMLESEISRANEEILSLNEQVDVLKKREEDSALSLAENKLSIHRELEVKEEQNKQLQQDLKKITEYKDILAEAVVKYDYEFKQFEVLMNDRNLEIDKKVSQLQDLFTNKFEAIRLVQRDIKHKFIGIDEGAKSKSEREIKQRTGGTAADDPVVRNEEISRSKDELEIKNAQLLGLTTELKSCKSTISDLKDMLREVTMDWEQVKKEKECLIANILEYKRIIGKLRQDCNSIKVDIKQIHTGQEAMIDSANQKISTILKSACKYTTDKEEKENVKPSLALLPNEQGDPRDSNENTLCSNFEVSNVELKTIINENNALRKKYEQLTEENAQMRSKCDEFDNINSKNIKLISEIDELNFKLRDIAELQQTQDKLQMEMEGLKEKSQFGDNICDNNDHLTYQVSELREKLDHYDVVSQDNAALKRESIELKNKLAAVVNDMEILKSEQSKNIEIGIENFSRKATEYENMIANLTSKFTEQTLQLENLHDELAKQKSNFCELNNKYEIRNSEFKETNEAFVKQAAEMQELNEKYKTQSSEIDVLREKGTEMFDKLVKTGEVREALLVKLSEMEASGNNIIDDNNKKLDELKLSYENILKDLRLSEETKDQLLMVKTNEIEALSDMKMELRKEIERLEIETGKLEILENDKVALLLELEELKVNHAEVIRNNKELADELNNLSKLNGELQLSRDNLDLAKNKLTERVANLEAELEHLQKKLDEQRINNEQRISELDEQLKNCRVELRTAELNSMELSETIVGLRSQGSAETALRSVTEGKNEELAAQVIQLRLKLEEFENLRQENVELDTIIQNLNPKMQMLNDVEAKNVELLSEINELNLKIAKLEGLENENCTLKSKIENFKYNIIELEARSTENTELHNKLKVAIESMVECATEVQNLRQLNATLATQIENLQFAIMEKEAEVYSLKNTETSLVCELENLTSEQSKVLDDKSKIINELKRTSEKFESTVAEQQQEIIALKITNQELQQQLAKISAHHSETLKGEAEKISRLEATSKELENEAIHHKREVDALKMTNEELEDRLMSTGADHSKALEDKAKRITELEKQIKDFENKLLGRCDEVDALEATNKDLREQLMGITENKHSDEALIQSYNLLQEESTKLRTRLDEAVVLCETKESQIQILNQQLKDQTQTLTEKLKMNDEEQAMRVKQLVKEFQAQIHDKDEQIQAALEKRFERQQIYESDSIQQYKEQLKDFQVELTAKSEQIESLILDNKETIQAYKDQIGDLSQTIAEIKREHGNELQNIEQNWKSILKQRTDQLETKHLDEVNELTKEWLNERKAAEYSDTSSRELESTSRVAMATIQSNTGSLHSLQQTLISQKRELSELRKLLRIRNDSLEGSTEIEYLRNILFEYMMGRETLVLTRVISAVVKFDQEQTSKVLKKEEDKLTLLGSLGIL